MKIVDLLNGWFRKLPTWPIYVIGVAHIAWLVWLGATGGLGVEPINALEHVLGLTGVQVLICGLAITPLRRFVGLNLIRFRRALGLTALIYVVAHLLVWLVLDLQSIGQIWGEIIKRPYITVGMICFTAMVPLALTSNNWSIRKLGPAWRRMHQMVYLIVPLAVLHFIMQRKGLQLEPLIYMAIVIGLLMVRVKWRQLLTPAKG